MTEGNGIDIGSIHGLLVEIARTVSRHDAMLEYVMANMVTKVELAAVRAEMAKKGELSTGLASIRADMATKADLNDLRRTVDGYHASVVGHGIAITEHGERLTHLESHLDLPPAHA